ncbi:hypothetical protein HELRODRAFT_185385 [Helobdella robusta]|uniref:Secretory carrier-associated membrane protein n=1 Tax=Helobdella robusta TaxID=6412 RepID=T1FMR1_HELRO|nr:hypothetical protein HELRODRAFT_185385 [Helobdella robusta]ESO09035.1 hypothetical protein HELRODRAFT_185385 [Helobdella robusta]
MDDFDDNPFADPSISQARPPPPTLQPIDHFNPFATENNAPSQNNQPAVLPTAPSDPPYSGGTKHFSQAPPPYVTKQLNTTTEDLRRQQEELDRRAAELERREQELRRNMDPSARVKNFPPLPSWFCLKPCFYQDISLEIPMEFQKLVRYHFHLWIAYCCVLLVNIIGSISLMAIHGSEAGSTFGLSILFFVLFTPLSFVCWFRPIYDAFKKDSSFNFFLYFFVFFMQFCVSVIQCLGISGSGTVGFINGLTSVSANIGVGLFLVLIGILFAGVAGTCMYFLFKVHRIYRSSGASFAKAQEEFAKGVFSNPTVRQTAVSVASTAARSNMEQGRM